MTRLTVAFASIRHADTAIAFVRGASFDVRWSPPAGGGDFEFATVDFEVARRDVRRLRTLLAGVHGLVLKTEPAVAVAMVHA